MTSDGSLEIRPPRQQRSREAWGRVLDAGVALLEEGGYEAFTIAAVCERAGVPPRALYARADNKDALFLAVYEHGIARVRADHDILDAARWRGLPPERLVAEVVRATAGIFARHAAFLRAVVLISGVHAEVYRRGAAYSTELGERFTRLLLGAGIGPETAVRTAFTAVFSTLVLRTAYGPTFAGPAVDEDGLTEMVSRYLV
ncbi:TetR/AcrR family transcriptional regulator [Actinoplanes sp. CA-142083]|uniref:TetR/AcrR family transcriptional regulator n=1 Tax=Actinoplanes sp. CA-142083 TaxID=3239903 RepID=UPI003D8D9A15